jgi:hypothetical protein
MTDPPTDRMIHSSNQRTSAHVPSSIITILIRGDYVGHYIFSLIYLMNTAFRGLSVLPFVIISAYFLLIFLLCSASGNGWDRSQDHINIKLTTRTETPLQPSPLLRNNKKLINKCINKLTNLRQGWKQPPKRHVYDESLIQWIFIYLFIACFMLVSYLAYYSTLKMEATCSS